MAQRRYKKGPLITAMIPARMGSERLPMKNLALINGRPLIYYAIKSAKESGVFDRIIINSEDERFKKIASRYKVGFYNRPAKLGGSDTKADEVVYDFIKKNPCDIIAWVNPTSPLQTGEEIRKVAGFFLKNKLGSLITVKNEEVHCIYRGKPVNFKIKGPFAKTQDLIPVQSFVYSVMMWRSDTFTRAFERHGYAFFCGKAGFYPVGKLSSIIIKRKEDLMLAEYILRQMKKSKDYEVGYDKIAPILRGGNG